MKITIKTNGKGIWSNSVAEVKCIDYEVIVHSAKYGELRIFFDTKTWDVSKDGLIYTDPGFLIGLRKALVDKGMSIKAANTVNYSEQGMQKKDYVSFDIGEAFIKEAQRVDLIFPV